MTVTTLDGLHSGVVRKVRGDYITDDGFIVDLCPKYMLVIVTDDGLAYPHLYADAAYNADADGALAPLKAEVWANGGGIYLGRQFAPDEGELERCGIRYEARP